jgi:hypothetical protein
MEMKVPLAMRSKAIIDRPLPAGPGLSVRAPIKITFGSKPLLTLPIDIPINAWLSHQGYRSPPVIARE